MCKNADQNNSGFEHFSCSDSKKCREVWSAPFYFIQKTNKLSVKFLFSGHSLMIVVICYSQSKPKHVKYFTQHALIFLHKIPSSKFEVKMERTKFYDTLYNKALEFASSRDLIQQTHLIEQNTTKSTPKSSNQIKY